MNEIKRVWLRNMNDPAYVWTEFRNMREAEIFRARTGGFFSMRTDVVFRHGWILEEMARDENRACKVA